MSTQKEIRLALPRLGLGHIAPLLAEYGVLIAGLLWVAHPIYEVYTASAGGKSTTLGEFLVSLSAPAAFIPGMLGLFVAVIVMTLEAHRDLKLRVEAESKELREQVTQLLEVVVLLRDGSRDVASLERVYSRVTSNRGSTAPIAAFARDIYESALQQLSQLDAGRCYTLDVTERERARRYAEAWISAFDRIMTSQEAGVFKTVSNMVIWSSDSLGFSEDGRHSAYHDKQISSVVRDRLRIQRIFVMPPRSLLGQDLAQARKYLSILETYQLRIDELWAKLTSETSTVSSSTPISPPTPAVAAAQAEARKASYQSRVFRAMDSAQYAAHFETQGGEKAKYGSQNFALWSVGAAQPVVANTVEYDSPHRKEGPLSHRALRSFSFTWDTDVIESKASSFEELWPLSIPLEEYIVELRDWLLVEHARTSIAEIGSTRPEQHIELKPMAKDGLSTVRRPAD